MSEQLKYAEAALEDPGLRKALEQEMRIDDCEQKMFELQKRIDRLRPKVNLELRVAVRTAIVTRDHTGPEDDS